MRTRLLALLSVLVWQAMVVPSSLHAGSLIVFDAPEGTRRVVQGGSVVKGCAGRSNVQILNPIVAPDGALVEGVLDDGGTGSYAAIFSSEPTSCEGTLRIDLSGRMIVGLALGIEGQLWVNSNAPDFELLEIDLEANAIVGSIPLPAEATVAAPRLQDIDADGFFYLFDASSSVSERFIRVVGPNGTLARTISLGSRVVQHVRVAPNGDLWVTGTQALYHLSSNGREVAVFPTAQFGFSGNVVFEPDGTLWVGSRTFDGSPSIRRITVEGATVQEIDLPWHGSLEEGYFLDSVFLAVPPINYQGWIRGKLYDGAGNVEAVRERVVISAPPGGPWTAVRFSHDSAQNSLGSIEVDPIFWTRNERC